MDRRKIVVKNVSLGVFYKVLNLCLVFTTIPILLNYLEKEQYGIWVTIFSVVNIVFFVDAGIGNGLKTRLTEALSHDKIQLAKEYISSAYITISCISILVLLIGSVLIFSLDLKELLNASIGDAELKIIFSSTLFMIVIGFVLSIYKALYYAKQQASKIELSMLIYQLIILASVIIINNFFTRDLLFVALIYGGSNIVISILFTIFFFRKNKEITPSFSSFNKQRIKDLMGLSLDFFFIQLCMIVIFTTDNIIISKLLGPSEVTTYDIVYKLFQLVIIFSLILQDPLWALYTDAYQKKDFKWIKKTIIKLNKLFILLVLCVIILFFIAKPIIALWTQRELSISSNLLILMSVFVIIRVYGIIYMNFINAIGAIKLQKWLYIIGAIVNIPLSVFFVNTLEMGSSGVILGTIISIISLSLLLPIQTYKILNKE